MAERDCTVSEQQMQEILRVRGKEQNSDINSKMFQNLQKKSGLRCICVYCSEDRKMLGKQTPVLAETKGLTGKVKSRCDG